MLRASMRVVYALDERGATSIEYALLASLVAVVIIAAVTLLGFGVVDLFTDDGLSSALD